MKVKYWIPGLLIFTAMNIYADDISIGYPGHGGSGCPQNTVSATLSPDAKQLSVLFDQYFTEAGGAKTIDRKTCNLAIPIHVPNGISLSILQVDYRGYNGLPRGADALLTAEYFFADRPGPKMSKTFVGPVDDEYYITNKLVASAVTWSPCGKDVNLRINTAVRAKTNARKEQALSTLDSVDLSAGLIYQLQFRRCN